MNAVRYRRRFAWAIPHIVEAPAAGMLIEIYDHGGDEPPFTRVRPRKEVVSRVLSQLHPPGRQHCYTFDARNGITLHFGLHLPPKYQHQATGSLDGHQSSESWPLLIFFHAMHNRLDADCNLFYDSDTPPRLLLNDNNSRSPSAQTPAALREHFVVLSPQCPPAMEDGDSGGLWLRRGWYWETSSYDHEMEAALGQLIEAVCSSCSIDRDRISATGISMGGYACLELVSRWPRYFAAAVPVAAHYEGDLDELAQHMTSEQSVPLWFFHGTNDEVCPYSDMERLVWKLRALSKSEVHMTSFKDSWSNSGHAADRAAYLAEPFHPHHVAMGNELCEWLLWQQRKP
eukprot:gnl/TRDRNA2_/TRDRNA2_86825_c0_seq1.p1 gnl/TRDRNA2_/TRDRNA2_86825_c0~~gnl/TRDRNA2_/TRDRNA2_86825_c0_seq1.p1  ORF type:complete len:385 (+),score=47.51 gnl/TRDRNA2_/TRDRNA2_86825_c0_seq1:128-1156(+)